MNGGSLRVRALSTGTTRHLEAILVRGGRLRLRTLPTLVGLLEHHRRGIVLFDTGYAPRVRAVRGLLGRVYRVLIPFRAGPRDRASNQLRERGIPADAVGTVVISHLHPDHVGGLRDFSRAQLVLGSRALDALADSSGWRALRRGLMRELIPDDFSQRVRPVARFDGAPLGEIPAADLFGDGSLRVVDLPGHAPGHVGLLAEDGERPTLFAGDACWLSRALREARPPSLAARWISEDRVVQHRTLESLRRLTHESPEVRIVPSHCPQAGGALCCA